MAKFNAEKYMIPLKGKEYLPVAARVAWFREEHPQGCIATDLRSVGNTLFARAEIHVDDVLIATGMASVRSGQNQVWNGREIEKAETAAIGRALAAAGYGTLQAGEDLDEGDYLADSPVDTAPPPPANDARWSEDDMKTFVYKWRDQGGFSNADMLAALDVSGLAKWGGSLKAADTAMNQWIEAQMENDKPATPKGAGYNKDAVYTAVKGEFKGRKHFDNTLAKLAAEGRINAGMTNEQAVDVLLNRHVEQDVVF